MIVHRNVGSNAYAARRNLEFLKYISDYEVYLFFFEK
jgi:hypothetical protein